jgi:hypothetical protein
VFIDPLVRGWYRGRGIGNTVDLIVPGRRTGRPRPVLLGLLRVGDRVYLGHPNGDVAWTRNLEAAGAGEVRPHDFPAFTVRPVRLGDGDERDAVISATWHQHPFPGNVLYFLARRHIRAVGAYFRLEPA